jgi:hypothetical protein
LSPAAMNELSSSASNLDPPRLLRLTEVASVGLIQAYRDLDSPDLVLKGRLSKQTSSPLRIYQNLRALPRAYLVGSAIPESGAPLDSLTRGDWEPRESVILEGITKSSGSPGSVGEVRWEVDGPQRQELSIRAERTGWVVVTDNFYPGWSARLDGKMAPLLRANHLFRAVAVPAGSHRLVFSYEPTSWRIGAVGSLASLAAGVIWLFRRGRSA